MNASEKALQGKHTATAKALYMAFELSDTKWILCLSDGVRRASQYTVGAGDQAAVLSCIAKAQARCALGQEAVVHSCYEAGRDGFWLHRWLVEQGIDNMVVDSSSIEVNRRARRAKSDRLDAGKLLTMLMRYHAGERRLWSVARVPTAQEEDARRVHRELARLHRQELPPCLRGEIEREMARLVLVKEQIRMLAAEQRNEVAAGTQTQVAQLARVRGVGLGSAWVLVKELFGWRRFHNRREVAGCIGLAPTPYASGEDHIEQGISKAGNKRVRALMVELAWTHLRFQPDSEMSRWFNERFAHGGKRMRRIGIVALARRLAIALWRYLEHGVIPTGAKLKPVGG